MKNSSIYFSWKIFTLSIILSGLMGLNDAFAQLSANKYKVVLCYGLVKNVKWENGISGSAFNFGVVTKDKGLIVDFKDLNSQKAHGKGINIVELSSLDNVSQQKYYMPYISVQILMTPINLLEFFLKGKKHL